MERASFGEHVNFLFKLSDVVYPGRMRKLNIKRHRRNGGCSLGYPDGHHLDLPCEIGSIV